MQEPDEQETLVNSPRQATPYEHRRCCRACNPVADADDATAEIVRFDAETGQIAAPFSSMLLRTESASSSRIKNLTAGARQLGLAELGASNFVNAQLVVSNVRAMQAALAPSDRIDATAIIDMHRELLVA